MATSDETARVPRRMEDIPWRRRQAYARAMTAFMQPADPQGVSLAESDAFMRTPEWECLFAALEEVLRPERGESIGPYVIQLFEHMKREGVLHD